VLNLFSKALLKLIHLSKFNGIHYVDACFIVSYYRWMYFCSMKHVHIIQASSIYALIHIPMMAIIFNVVYFYLLSKHYLFLCMFKQCFQLNVLWVTNSQQLFTLHVSYYSYCETFAKMMVIFLWLKAQFPPIVLVVFCSKTVSIVDG